MAGASLLTLLDDFATVLDDVAILAKISARSAAGAIDDAGLHLSQRPGDNAWAALRRRLGFGILTAAPWLMKGLSIAGTAGMSLVGGGILVHGIPAIEHWTAGLAAQAGGILEAIVPTLANALVGIVAGGIAVAVVAVVGRLRAGAR